MSIDPLLVGGGITTLLGAIAAVFMKFGHLRVSFASSNADIAEERQREHLAVGVQESIDIFRAALFDQSNQIQDLRQQLLVGQNEMRVARLQLDEQCGQLNSLRIALVDAQAKYVDSARQLAVANDHIELLQGRVLYLEQQLREAGRDISMAN